jgi:rubrerythrin
MPNGAYIKYFCPVCEAVGNKHQLIRNEENCPLCNVNLLWDEV